MSIPRSKNSRGQPASMPGGELQDVSHRNGVWDIVSGEKKPSSTLEGEIWTQNSYRAQALLFNMEESLTPLIALAEDAH